MDRLPELVDLAGPLLRRVDELIAQGAPEDHGLWIELRRVRLLPTEAVRAVAALRPEALNPTVPRLRRHARDVADAAELLAPPHDWTGDAADAYDARRQRMIDHLGGHPHGLTARLEDSADLAQDLVEWLQAARHRVALALADVLASAEAVVLAGAAAAGGHTITRAELAAAAAIATRVLRAVADSYDRAQELLDRSLGLAEAELFRPPNG